MDSSMHLQLLDWFFIVAYAVIAFGIGVYFSKRASQSTDEFFIAGRNLPWWLAGTSMVATSFAADTPLAVSGFIRSAGIYENWIWWSSVMGGMLCVFFFARLWRRAQIVTDVEFIELRYQGRPASALRGFMAVYSGVLSNCITMGWVMLAMIKILDVMLGWPRIWSIAVLVLFTLAYTIMSGFWGVVMTDLVQFAIAMGGAISLAVIVVVKMGGFGGMVEQISAAPGFEPKLFHMVPDFHTATKLAILTFLVQVSVQWWGGGQGGGYMAQRLFATHNEKHSALAALWFNFAHYVIRPWPWIIVGLASVVYFPLTEGSDPEAAYPMMMARFLPIGLKGLMVASLLAAFMSTMDTHLNWGASYLVTDLYRRFLVKSASEKHYVNASRWAMVLLMILAAITAWQSESIKKAWIYLMVLTSGAGFVGLLRWYWWRVNAWSEVSALLSSFFIANGEAWAAILRWMGLLSEEAMADVRWFYSTDMFAVRILVIITVCTAIWVVVTLLTKPVPDEHLEKFYRRVRPGGWWGHVAKRCPDVHCEPAVKCWLGWFCGCVSIYCGLFGLGYICLAKTLPGVLLLAVSLVSGWFMVTHASMEPEAGKR